MNKLLILVLMLVSFGFSQNCENLYKDFLNTFEYCGYNNHTETRGGHIMYYYNCDTDTVYIDIVNEYVNLIYGRTKIKNIKKYSFLKKEYYISPEYCSVNLIDDFNVRIERKSYKNNERSILDFYKKFRTKHMWNL